MERVSPPAVQSLECQVWRVGDERALAGVRAAPDEAAIGIAFDSRAYVVVMGTPLDVEDLARGFAISERIARPDEIERVSVSATPDGLMADVRLAPAAGRALGLARRRAQESRSSCGLCGIERLSDAVRTMPRLAVTLRLSREAVQRALAELENAQHLGRATRATHAAAWADGAGAVLLVREDVGRHNALDKLIGAAAAAGLDPARALVVVTSRCSYEMVEKTVAAGVQALAAVSAPTALAVRQAKAAGLTLIALARPDGHSLFAGAERMAAP